MKVSSINFGHNVLIADDDPMMRKSTSLILKHFLPADTLELTEVGSAKEAIDKINSNHKFDLVVTDGHMESSLSGINIIDADGIKVIKKSKESNIPSILASSDDRLKPFAEDLGAKFLDKVDSSFVAKMGQMVKNILKIN